ncbi:type IV pilin N-terminal domain-containing protein [Halobacteria archaeon AArc-m2/3/4]|uniref:Type IV pilin N-terminal domain-containing protein n=1 Tax=Natronoglomus mannanivorans TaxID=2979990 RepID=A0ABT2QDE7_9EURY|nr:type IV pilin N-terminal domain-containing protein [Halobacteria archaeon AArc-m2/3/4]
MNFAKKLVGNEEERAVSPVIGVILMVAITVILAAVIAAFVLDLGQSQSASASAAFEFSQDGGTLTATLIAEDRVDDNPDYTVTSSGTSDHSFASPGISDVGDSAEIEDWNEGESVTITADYQGSTSVVATYSG